LERECVPQTRLEFLQAFSGHSYRVHLSFIAPDESCGRRTQTGPPARPPTRAEHSTSCRRDATVGATECWPCRECQRGLHGDGSERDSRRGPAITHAFIFPARFRVPNGASPVFAVSYVHWGTLEFSRVLQDSLQFSRIGAVCAIFGGGNRRNNRESEAKLPMDARRMAATSYSHPYSIVK
jgi:hypothetical protein